MLVLAAELFLLEIDQLAEGHLQDGVGLHGGERVAFAVAPLGGEDGKARVAQGAAHEGRGHSMPIKRALASACVADVRMTRITSSMLACASSKPFDRVLALPRLGQQELRTTANHMCPMADELFEQFLDRQRARLAVDQGQEISEIVSCSGEN